jgi:PAS domain S-box-containing protein
VSGNPEPSEIAVETRPAPAVPRLDAGFFGRPLFDALKRCGLAIAVTGPVAEDCPVLYCNDAFSRLTGYPVEEILGRNCRFLQAPETDRKTVARIRTALAEGEAVEVDILNVRKDRGRFWNRLQITPIHDAEGAAEFFLATQVDASSELASEEIRLQLATSLRQLADARERLRAAQAVSGAAGCWEWDIAENRLYGDARFASLCGLDLVAAAKGLPTKAFFAAIHPDDLKRIRIGVAAMLNGAEVFAKDYRIIGPGGAVLWVSARGHVELDEQDEPVRFCGVLADITQQRRIEDKLAIAQIAGGIGTFEYLSGFGTAEVSKQFCALLGLREADVLPLRTINAVVHPDDPPIVGGSTEQALGPSYREFRVLRADTGELRWLARRGVARRDGPEGIRFIGVLYDVTAAKKAEEDLRELNQTLEQRVRERTQERDQVWKLSKDLLCVLTTCGKLRAVNPAWETVLGHREDELIGRSVETLAHAGDVAGAAERLNAVGKGEEVGDFDCRLRHKNGHYLWFNWTARSEGDVFYAIGRDVTQRKTLEEALRQSQKMEAVGQLTGGLAHDFNNMLAGILAGMEVLRRRIESGRTDGLMRLIDMAVASAERAAALTHRLLAFSRRQSLDSRAVDVNALIGSMADLFRRTLGESITVALQLAPDAWTALGDLNQLESAILNLAINARDAMPGGGTLTIMTRNAVLDTSFTRDHPDLSPGDYVEIAVQDTGTGMAPDVLQRAFEPFYTTKPIGQGTGLGLSMVYGFAQQSKGHIAIDSTLGVGTTVRLHLPRCRAETGIDSTSEAQVETPQGAGESVLLVEDDPSVRELISEVLRELGYTAVKAKNADEAIAILRSDESLGLMISDVGLPGLSGRQLAEIARKARPGLRILFMTGYAAEAVHRPVLLGPRMDLMLKPFSIDAMALKIRGMMDGKS